jgi:hypothetical protein
LDGNGVIEQADALLRYYFKVETDNLSDEKFMELYAKVQWIMDEKRKGHE